ncbi:hypothetical protein ACFO5R_09905 [Halosolutus amylolyticus]|uniref:Uncharacterized protein n=1 Tax=Halosolutus amylolyticus TaxID=2932267 RepID=A0ABD5PNS3_9EURY|nr:hypothetical protein [Halosolutus amylolyticus]
MVLNDGTADDGQPVGPETRGDPASAVVETSSPDQRGGRDDGAQSHVSTTSRDFYYD